VAPIAVLLMMERIMNEGETITDDVKDSFFHKKMVPDCKTEWNM
jgi:hypothetical protein